MKTLLLKSTVLFVCAAAAIMYLTGCATRNLPHNESMLIAAGFSFHKPQNAKQQKIYDEAPASKMERVTYNGKVFYVYKDAGKAGAYVGTEAQYEEYKNLAIQRNVARQNYTAAEMDRHMAWDWYDSYGPYVLGR